MRLLFPNGIMMKTRYLMTYNQWEIVLLPFPFTDLSARKKRPAVVISPTSYNSGPDTVVLFMTSKMDVSSKEGDYRIKKWQFANLPKPSQTRMKFATIDNSFILKKIGEIHSIDQDGIKSELRKFLGI